MEYSLENRILQTENKWLPELKKFLFDHFNGIFLPSHDTLHHLRTWGHAKRVLSTVCNGNEAAGENYIEAILLTALFHDTGMTETRDPAHGYQSRKIFSEYIENRPGDPPALYEKICDAIENHDRKEQRVASPFTKSRLPDPGTLAGLGDDMDALGKIGIYRYTEICLHRKISLENLGTRILENAASRFRNLASACTNFPEVTDYARPGYLELTGFFDNYNQQLLVEDNPLHCRASHIGVINYIRHASVEGTTRPEDFPAVLKKNRESIFVAEFFEGLKTEIDAFNE